MSVELELAGLGAIPGELGNERAGAGAEAIEFGVYGTGGKTDSRDGVSIGCRELE